MVGEEYAFESIKAEDSGSYKCTAQNSAGSGNSGSTLLKVLCEFYSICVH